MNLKTCLIAVSALAVGGALGFFFATAQAAGETPNAGETPSAGDTAPTHAAIRSEPADATISRLRARVADLERKLAALHAQVETAPEAAETNRASAMPPPGDHWRARMEEMRKNDPQRYASMTNHMATFRARQLERVTSQLDTLSSINSDNMTPRQRACHEQFQELLARREELMELMRPDSESVTAEERTAAMKEMGELHRQLHDLQQTERDTLLTMAIKDAGVSAAGVAETIDTIKAVYQATETFGGFGGPGRRGGRGGAGGPPPPPR